MRVLAVTHGPSVGPGVFARSTLLPALRSQGVELAAVAGLTPARAFGSARRWKARYAASDPLELIEDPSIDVVVIATGADYPEPARFARTRPSAGAPWRRARRCSSRSRSPSMRRAWSS